MPYYWARRDIRQPEEKTIAFAYSFMGMRIQCAQCHKHPFDVWSKEDFDGFKEFFTHILASNNSAPDARDEYQKIVDSLDTEGLRGGELRRKMASLLEEGKTIPFGEVYTREIRKGNDNNRNRVVTTVRNTQRCLAARRSISLSMTIRASQSWLGSVIATMPSWRVPSSIESGPPTSMWESWNRPMISVSATRRATRLC